MKINYKKISYGSIIIVLFFFLFFTLKTRYHLYDYKKSFIDHNDGTIRSVDSKIMWQQGQYLGGNGKGVKIGDISIDWYGATRYCGNLSLAGHEDWRLPSKAELKSIVYCSEGHPVPFEHSDSCNRGSDQPAIADPFVGYLGSYWTSEIQSGSSAYVVDFIDGKTKDSFVTSSTLIYARCVRDI